MGQSARAGEQKRYPDTRAPRTCSRRWTRGGAAGLRRESVRKEHGDRGVLDQSPGHSAQSPFVRSGMPVTADNEELGVRLPAPARARSTLWTDLRMRALRRRLRRHGEEGETRCRPPVRDRSGPPAPVLRFRRRRAAKAHRAARVRPLGQVAIRRRCVAAARSPCSRPAPSAPAARIPSATRRRNCGSSQLRPCRLPRLRLSSDRHIAHGRPPSAPDR